MVDPTAQKMLTQLTHEEAKSPKVKCNTETIDEALHDKRPENSYERVAKKLDKAE